MNHRVKACFAFLPSRVSTKNKRQKHFVDSRKTNTVPCCCCRMANILRTLISKNRIRYLEDGFNLDLCYVTNRIIAMGYPAEGGQGLLRNPRSEIVRLLTQNHQGHYRVYNLCMEQSYDPSCLGGQVAHFPFGDHQAPPLSLIVQFCEDAEQWLLANPRNTVVVHCKAGKGRTGIMICALLMHMGLCNGPEEALGLFAERRTADGRGVTIASQRRYVGYFYRLMASGMRMRASRTLQLQYIKLTGFSKSMLSRLVVCLYGRHPQTQEMIPLAEIKSAATTKHAANNVHSISPSGRSSIGLFPHGERYHLLMNNQEFYVIFEIDAGDGPKWTVRGDFKIQVFEETLSKRNSLFFAWFNASYIDEECLTIPRTEMDKVMRCLPGQIQMEVMFSDPRSWGPTTSLSGHSNNRLFRRSHSVSRTGIPTRPSRHGQTHSVVASSTFRAACQDQGNVCLCSMPQIRGMPTSLMVPFVPTTTEESWLSLTRNWDKYWMSTTAE